MSLNRLQKAASVFAAVTLLLPGNLFSVPLPKVPAPSIPAGSIAEDPAGISVPSELGKIEESYRGRPGDLVILVRDAHSIPQAQINICKLIDFAQHSFGLKTVALEGAASRLNPQIFRSFPDGEILKKTLKEYEEQGELPGTVLASMTNAEPASYTGIEDWKLYEAGYGYFLRALANSEALSGELGKIRSAHRMQKEKAFSPRLLEVDGLLEQFEKNESGLLPTLKGLASIKPPPEKSELALMIEESVSAQESSPAVESELKKLAEGFRRFFASGRGKNGLVEEQAAFNERFQQFQTSAISSQEFALFLRETASRIGLPFEMPPGLLEAAKRHKKMRDIEGTRFFEAFEEYASSVKSSLFRSGEERRLDGISRRLFLLERLARMELTKKEWGELAPGFDPEPAGSMDPPLSEGLRKLFAPHVLFYRNSEQRDGVFFHNLRKLLAEQAGTPGAQGSVLFVAGGFHTENLTASLKQAGISYLLIAPKIDDLPGEIHYRDHMRGLVSWRNYFRVENGRINLYRAFVRATRDRLVRNWVEAGKGGGKDRGELLKLWRDQIIRDLAADGRLLETQDYTRFLDEIERKGESLERDTKTAERVDEFLRGMKDLKARGELTEANILKLLRPSNMEPAVLIPAEHQEIDAADLSGFVLPFSQSAGPEGELTAPAGRAEHRPAAETVQTFLADVRSLAGGLSEEIFGRLSSRGDGGMFQLSGFQEPLDRDAVDRQLKVLDGGLLDSIRLPDPNISREELNLRLYFLIALVRNSSGFGSYDLFQAYTNVLGQLSPHMRWTGASFFEQPAFQAVYPGKSSPAAPPAPGPGGISGDEREIAKLLAARFNAVQLRHASFRPADAMPWLGEEDTIRVMLKMLGIEDSAAMQTILDKAIAVREGRPENADDERAGQEILPDIFLVSDLFLQSFYIASLIYRQSEMSLRASMEKIDSLSKDDVEQNYGDSAALTVAGLLGLEKAVFLSRSVALKLHELFPERYAAEPDRQFLAFLNEKDPSHIDHNLRRITQPASILMAPPRAGREGTAEGARLFEARAAHEILHRLLGQDPDFDRISSALAALPVRLVGRSGRITSFTYQLRLRYGKDEAVFREEFPVQLYYPSEGFSEEDAAEIRRAAQAVEPDLMARLDVLALRAGRQAQQVMGRMAELGMPVSAGSERSETRKTGPSAAFSSGEDFLRMAAQFLQSSLQNMETGWFPVDQAAPLDSWPVQDIDPWDSSKGLPYPGGVNVGIFDSVQGLEAAIHYAANGTLPGVNFMLLSPDGGTAFGARHPDRLYAKYGVFMRDGRIILARFTKPVPLHAMVYGGAYASRVRERLHESGIPLLNSPAATELMDHKVRFVDYLSRHGFAVPDFEMLEPGLGTSEVQARIRAFAAKYPSRDGYALKPADAALGEGVKLFGADEIESAARHASSLLARGSTMLLQKRIFNELFRDPSSGKLMDWNLRVISGWKDGKFHLTPEMILVRYRPAGKEAVNLAKGAGGITLQEFFDLLKFDAPRREAFFRSIVETLAPVAEALEKDLTPAGAAMNYRHTGIVGWDLILSREGKWHFLEANVGSLAAMDTLEKRAPRGKKGSIVLPFASYLKQTAEDYRRAHPEAGEDTAGEAMTADDAYVIFNLSILFSSTGQYREAVKTLEYGMTLSPSPSIRNYMERTLETFRYQAGLRSEVRASGKPAAADQPLRVAAAALYAELSGAMEVEPALLNEASRLAGSEPEAIETELVTIAAEKGIRFQGLVENATRLALDDLKSGFSEGSRQVLEEYRSRFPGTFEEDITLALVLADHAGARLTAAVARNLAASDVKVKGLIVAGEGIEVRPFRELFRTFQHVAKNFFGKKSRLYPNLVVANLNEPVRAGEYDHSFTVVSADHGADLRDVQTREYVETSILPELAAVLGKIKQLQGGHDLPRSDLEAALIRALGIISRERIITGGGNLFNLNIRELNLFLQWKVMQAVAAAA